MAGSKKRKAYSIKRKPATGKKRKNSA